MKEKGAPSRRRGQEIKPGQMWWKLPEDQVPGALMSTLQHIRRDQVSLENENRILSRLYGGRVPSSVFGTPHHAIRGMHPSLSGRLTYNLMAIVMDTLVSKITKENLSTQFITQGGNYRQQRRAKKLTQFADGIRYETKMDDLAPDIFRDGLLSPVGVAHTFADPQTGRVKTERVMSAELFVDYQDGFYGNPTQIHRARMADRDRLLEAWGWVSPEVRKAIENNHDTGPFGGEFQSLSDQIAVGESWHLPSGLEEDGKTPTKDGKHIVYISNCILNPEDQREWNKMRFPFSVFRWKQDTEGWHGIPLGRDLIGSQVEMNHLLIMFQRAFRMQAAFRVWVETGTVPDQHFQDKIGTILHGPKGSQPPQFLTPPALNEQYFRHFDAIKNRAFEAARLSQLSAFGQKPAGLDSGEAQRVFHDIEAEGFSFPQKLYEDFNLDVTSLQVDTVRDIFLEEKKYRLRAPVQSSTLPGQRFLRSLDWRAVQLDEDEYILKGYSTSSLPSTPAGRLATIQDMMRAGLLDPDTGRRLLNFPDLAAVQTLLGAAEDWIMSCLDDIIDNGEQRKLTSRPDPYMNLKMAETLGIQEYSLGAANGMEEEKLELLRAWVGEVQRLQSAAQQAALAQQVGAAQAIQAATAPPVAPGANGTAPMGVGAPPQTSAMLPAKGMQGSI